MITDSEGLQKEACFAEVPALVMMPYTSWIELIEDAAFHHEPSMSGFSELYGSGDAGEKIVEIISRQLL